MGVCVLQKHLVAARTVQKACILITDTSHSRYFCFKPSSFADLGES